MEIFDEIDSICNSVAEDIASQEVSVNTNDRWMFYLSLSDAYSRRDLHPDDDDVLKKVQRLFRVANYPYELIYPDDERAFPEFAFDIPENTSFKFLVKFFEIIERMPLYLSAGYEHKDKQEIKLMSDWWFIYRLTELQTDEIRRRIVNLEKREISIYYEDKEIERWKKRMLWNMEYAFDCDIRTDFIQISGLKDSTERLVKTTYYNLRDDDVSWRHTQDKSTNVRMCHFNPTGWYLCRVVCGSRWSDDHYKVHYMILVFKAFDSSDVYWFIKDSTDVGCSVTWEQYRRDIIIEFIGKTDGNAVSQQIEYKECCCKADILQQQSSKIMCAR